LGISKAKSLGSKDPSYIDSTANSKEPARRRRYERRTEATDAALPSTCAGRSMLRPYETGSRAAQKVSACGEMVRASKARQQKSRPAQIKSPGLHGMLANA